MENVNVKNDNNKINSAVILAAGMGLRLNSFFNNAPKGFLKVGGQSLIEQSIEKLNKVGINNIIIVTGYLSEFYDKLAEKFDFVKTVKNVNYEVSGSLYSFYCAKDALQTKSDSFLVLESDIIYEVKALEALIDFEKNNAVLMSGLTYSGDEVYVETTGDRIVDMAKNKRMLESVNGEFVGISKISKKLYEKIVTKVEAMLENTLDGEYEYSIVQASKSTPIYYLKIDNLIWAEIDNYNHFNRVKKVILPKLQSM